MPYRSEYTLPAEAITGISLSRTCAATVGFPTANDLWSALTGLLCWINSFGQSAVAFLGDEESIVTARCRKCWPRRCLISCSTSASPPPPPPNISPHFAIQYPLPYTASLASPKNVLSVSRHATRWLVVTNELWPAKPPHAAQIPSDRPPPPSSSTLDQLIAAFSPRLSYKPPASSSASFTGRTSQP